MLMMVYTTNISTLDKMTGVIFVIAGLFFLLFEFAVTAIQIVSGMMMVWNKIVYYYNGIHRQSNNRYYFP